MASRTITSIALLLSLNLLFLTMVSSASCSCKTPSSPNPSNSSPAVPSPNNRSPNNLSNSPPAVPSPSNPSPSSNGACPRDTLKLGVCVDLLENLLNATIGTPPRTPCCSLINGLADLEAAICLCTTIRARLLGINLNVPIDLSLLLNYCGRNVPHGFQCA